jgi:hypothetical protein
MQRDHTLKVYCPYLLGTFSITGMFHSSESWFHQTQELVNTDWVPVAHSCNSDYSGGKDQEDHSSKPAQANIVW